MLGAGGGYSQKTNLSSHRGAFSFQAELGRLGTNERCQWGMQVGMPTWQDGYQERPHSPQGSRKTPSHRHIHEEFCRRERRREWEGPLPLQGLVQPFPARVGGPGLGAAACHAGLFGGLSQARVQDEAPHPRTRSRQDSSQQLLVLCAAPLLGSGQGLAGSHQYL